MYILLLLLKQKYYVQSMPCNKILENDEFAFREFFSILILHTCTNFYIHILSLLVKKIGTKRYFVDFLCFQS